MNNYLQYPLKILLCVMLLMTILNDAYAQNFAVSPTNYLNQGDKETLSDRLKEIGEQHKVRFSFDKDVVENKFVQKYAITNKGLEELLKATLEPFQLSYEKIDEIHYVIIPKPETDKTIKKISREETPDLGMNPLGKLNRNAFNIMLSEKTRAIIEKTISGRVIDGETDEPLPGVNVLAKGTSSGTVTDIDGNYRLTVDDNVTALIFSSIGYVTEEVTLNNRNSIDVVLMPDITSLSEVVVVGYGTTTREDLTTSIAKVDPSNIPVAANPNVSDMLFGRAAGLRVVQQSSQPGGKVDLSIRGRGNPLIVIDGVIMPNTELEPEPGFSEIDGVNRGALAGLNPNDIESIEVLKDASAAIYGVNAGNGVILITTKQGKAGRLSVSYSGSRSYVQNMDFLEQLNATEYMTYFNRFDRDRYLAQNQMQPFGPNPASGFTPRFSPDDIAQAGVGTDWVGEVLRDGAIDNHNISISGGAEKVNYYFSGNYFNQIGTVQNSDMRKYSARMNLSYHFNNWLSLNTNINANRNFFTNSGTGGQTGSAGAEAFTALQAAYTYPAYLPIRDENGELTRFQTTGNPLSLLNMDDNTQYKSLLANISLDIDIIPDVLKGKLLYGNNTESSVRNFFIPSTVFWFNLSRSRASLDWSERQNQTMEATLSYTKALSDAIEVDALVGAAQYTYDQNSFGLSAQGMLDALNTTAVQAGTVTPIVRSDKSATKTRSFFARASVDILNKYIVTGSYRYDGFSYFFPESKFAGFPSASVGWKISNESFLDNATNIDLIKLRASIGTTGNTIGTVAYGNYAPDGIVIGFNDGSTKLIAYQLTSADQPDLTWQKTVTANVGLDFGFFNNRISGSLDWFRDDVTNLLRSNANTPALSFLAQQPVNGGHQIRTGYEVALNTDNVRTSDFNWSSTINISHFSYRWEERFEEDDLAPYQKVTDPVNAIYRFETDGILQLGEEAPAWQPEAAQQAGSPLFVDQNGDNQLDSADVIIYDQIPRLSIGFGNNFRYRNFDLNIFLYGQTGAYRVNNSLAWADPVNGILGGNIAGTTDLQYVWSSENQDGTLPGATYNEFALTTLVGSDYNISKANFLRARNITLGYTFNFEGLKQYVRELRVYLDVQNAFVITKYKGADPEVEARGVKGGPAPYPMARTYSLGVNVNF
ncbi:SusC/RagA family TonB-linked outer membrane protein [Catalinimonas sp. 4WD22]|uniref:SusC/RagA family TonB-linked outer membrane protein n=1 Tax=Catalinimonas locisalis TaxID=3133978 RepID=UPI0031019DE3